MRFKMSKISDSILKVIFFLPLTLFFIFFFILLLLFVAPFALYRKFLFYLVPFIKRDYGKILNLSAVPHAAHQTIVGGGVIAEFEISGQVDLEEFKKDYQEKILNPGGPFKEYLQYFVQFGGHYFWKNSTNFSIHQHIQFWPNPQQELNFVRKEVLLMEFEPGQPLWNIFLVENSSKDLTTILLKIHHAYGDGFTVMNIFLTLCNAGKTVQNPIKYQKKAISYPNLIAKILNTPYMVIQNYMHLFSEKISWTSNIKSEDFYLKPQEIPLGASKSIKKAEITGISLRNKGISVFSVVLAAICGGIRNFLIKNGVNVPPDSNLAVTTPRPRDPEDKLRNFVYLTPIQIPLGEANPLKRLKIIEERLKAFKSGSFLQEVSYLMGSLLCHLPGPLFKGIVMGWERPLVFPMLYSGIKESGLDWKGHPLQLVGFTAPAFRCGLPLLLTSVMTRSGLRFFGTGIKSVFSGDESIDELLDFILKEFDILAKCDQLDTCV